MDIELLIRSIVGLFVVLTVLVLLFIIPSRNKKKKQQQKAAVVQKQKAPQQKEEIARLSFDELRSRVRRSTTTTKELEEIIEEVVKHYSKIHPKMGVRTHPDFDKYIDLIVHLVRHKNTNKNLILKLDKALVSNNPDYKAELNDTLQKALNSRGI